MLRGRPWQDARCLDALPERRRSSWHASRGAGAPAASASPRRSKTTHMKETDPLLPTPKLFRKSSIFGGISSLFRHYGVRLMALVFVVQHMMKGFVMTITVVAELFLYKSYNVPATDMQVYQALTALPWALKPLTGLISDLFPVLGYQKAPYAIVTSVVGTAAFLAVGVLPRSAMGVPLLVGCLLLQCLMVTTTDTLTQGTFAQKAQETSSSRIRTSFLAFAWSGRDVGALLAAVCSGLVVQYLGPRVPYAIAVAPAAVLLALVLCGSFEERWMGAEETARVRRRFGEQWEVGLLSVLLAVCSLVLAALSTALAHSPLAHLALVGTIALAIVLASSLLLAPVVAKLNVFNFLFSLTKLAIDAAAFYWFTDDVEAYPEGPHFSPFFYGTVKGSVEFTFAIVGIFTYQYLSQGWTYRQWTAMATVIAAFAQVSEVLMYRRTNVYLGISDWSWCLGTTAITSLFDRWQWMPGVVAMSYMCPKGMEVTVFALLIGCKNIGWALASNLDAIAMQQLGIWPNGQPGESIQFENLWFLSMWGCVGFPVVVLLLCGLLPDAKMDESLIEDAPDAATAGSLLRRWTRWAEDEGRHRPEVAPQAAPEVEAEA